LPGVSIFKERAHHFIAAKIVEFLGCPIPARDSTVEIDRIVRNDRPVVLHTDQAGAEAIVQERVIRGAFERRKELRALEVDLAESLRCFAQLPVIGTFGNGVDESRRWRTR